ncbi:MAG: putative multiple sugar transporter substrate-binding protein [Actinomycetia bacterium]|nr:putative multiple sugar transporter substrate-binding protein [Actinomycetes bacterium]
MRLISKPALVVAAVALMAAAAGCSSGTSASTGTGTSGSGTTLTYWASDQGSSIADDYTVLNPELAKFQKQTGIKVKLEVIGWPDLLNRILAATTSGQGPDVVNIGNTWSASLQASGALLPWTSQAFSSIGGETNFVSSALGSTGEAGKPPAAVPLYSVAYALYYNKALFQQAGIAGPPATWADLIADGKKLTHGSTYGLAIEGASTPENIHHAFVFAKQHGCNFFDAAGNPTFTLPGCVQGVQQFVNLMGADKIVSPGDAEYDQNQSVSDFADGKAAMLMWQAAGANLKAHGMSTSQYGVAPVPVQSGTPGQGDNVDSMVAGINIAIFKNTKHLTAAEEFVKFMTSTSEQTILNKTYGSIPSVSSALQNPAFSSPELSVIGNVLSTSAAALPQVPGEAQFETLVGAAIKNLFADAASGHPVTAQTVEQQLASAQQQMTS